MKIEIAGEVEKNYTDEGISYMSINTKDIETQYQDEWMLDYLLSDQEGKRAKLTIEFLDGDEE